MDPDSKIDVSMDPDSKIDVSMNPNDKIDVSMNPNDKIDVSMNPNDKIDVSMDPNGKIDVSMNPNDKIDVSMDPNGKIDVSPNPNGKTNIPIHIYTKSTKALEKDSYIQIVIDDGYSSSPLSEGAKYPVLDISTVTETVDGVEFTYQAIKTTISQSDLADIDETIKNKSFKIFWTFAKDDMHHTLINKFFREGKPKKVRQVAKYCLKDCKLVNLLIGQIRNHC